MSKKESDIVKGIAILCMFFHHLFYKKRMYTTYGLTGLIGNDDITLTIAKDMKVCVAIFAFVSGYGMVMKMRNLEAKNVTINAKWHVKNIADSYLGMIKDTSFLIAIIVPTTLVLGLSRMPEAVWGDPSDIILGILSNMTGLAGFFRIEWFIHSWWYLKVAILFILMFPVLYALLKNKVGLIGLLVGYIFAVTCVPGINASHDNIWRYLPAFLFGIIAAEGGLWEKLTDWMKNNRKRYAFIVLLLFCWYVLFVFLKHKIGIVYVTQAVQAALVSLLSVVVLSKVPVVSCGLIFLGKNSKYMWLIHVYIYRQLLTDFLFSLKNIWLILIMLVAVSLPASIILRKICNRIFDFLASGIAKVICIENRSTSRF